MRYFGDSMLAIYPPTLEVKQLPLEFEITKSASVMTFTNK